MVLLSITRNQYFHQASHDVREHCYSTHHDEADEKFFQGAFGQEVTIADGGKSCEGIVPHFHHDCYFVNRLVLSACELITRPEIKDLPALIDIKHPGISPVFNVKTEYVEHDSSKITAAENDDDQSKNLIGFDNIHC